MKIDEIEKLFFSTIPIKRLSKQIGIDQRKIRKIWKNKFGNIKRHIIIKLNNVFIENIKNKLLEGKTVCDISKDLNISKEIIRRYLKTDITLYNISIKNNKEKRSKLLSNLHKKINKKDIVNYFDTDLFPKEIAQILNISASSIRNIFCEVFGLEKYKERVNRLKPLIIKKVFRSLELAGKCGSKSENIFYNILSESLNVIVKHHDLDIFPPFEIDVTIPKIKLAISWDGIGHFKPIYGEKIFRIVCNRDIQKRKYLESKGWTVINIKDINNTANIDFIMQQKNNILEIIKSLGFGDIIK